MLRRSSSVQPPSEGYLSVIKDPSDKPEKSDPDKYLSVVKDSADMVRSVHFLLLTIGVYFFILISTTTHKMLLMASDLPLPLLGVGVPIVDFYKFGPAVWMFLNLNLLLLLYQFSITLQEAKKSFEDNHTTPFHTRLQSFNIAHWLAGTHSGGMHFILTSYVFVTVLVFPLSLLLFAQIRFLPYHNADITWWGHRLPILLYLFSVWYFWPKIVSHLSSQSWRWCQVWDFLWLNRILALLLTFSVVLHTLFGATVPGEWADLWETNDDIGFYEENTKNIPIPYSQSVKLGVHVFRFMYGLEGARWFVRNLDVQDADLVKKEPTPEVIAIYVSQSKPVEDAWVEHAIGLDLRGRDLRRANFFRSRFYNVKFDEGTKLDNAVLDRAILKNLNIRNVHMEGVSLVGAQLDGTFMLEMHLEMANLSGATFNGTIIRNSSLKGANLSGTLLRGVVFMGSDLSLANLNQSHLQVANLSNSYIQMANLENAHLEGANLNGAHLEGANLSGAHLEGADLKTANLRGIIIESEGFLKGLKSAGLESDRNTRRMNRIYLTGADLRGAILDHADLMNIGKQVEGDEGRQNILDWNVISKSLNRFPEARKQQALKRLQDSEKQWEGARRKGFLTERFTPYPGKNTEGGVVECEYSTSFKSTLFERNFKEVLQDNKYGQSECVLPEPVAKKEYNEKYLQFLKEDMFCNSVLLAAAVVKNVIDGLNGVLPSCKNDPSVQKVHFVKPTIKLLRFPCCYTQINHLEIEDVILFVNQLSQKKCPNLINAKDQKLWQESQKALEYATSKKWTCSNK
ncbi:MAG: pentapeptide repeat-containing protein [Magnetococcales bacterium]|nr:pentapeptide repeat-containing protein [Magnetococcales bacterium]